MKKYIPLLKKTILFSGIGDKDAETMLDCFRARIRTYRKGEYVINCGDRIGSIMILAEGKLHIQRDDHWGNRSLISMITPAEMFGEAYATPGCEPFPNDVMAVEDSTVLFFSADKLLSVCPASCSAHSAVVRNLFLAISEKNRRLMQRMGCITQRTTRGKLTAYLSEQSERSNSPEFSIPFNRQQLADHLSVDRSAMSAELCRMRDEGLLDFEKNRFVLH